MDFLEIQVEMKFSFILSNDHQRLLREIEYDNFSVGDRVLIFSLFQTLDFREIVSIIF